MGFIFWKDFFGYVLIDGLGWLSVEVGSLCGGYVGGLE